MSDKPVILTVDDNQVILGLLAGMLQDEYIVIPALDGKVAMRYLEKKTPDLILLDWEMPGMKGVDVLREIKSNQSTAGIPVIFLTGNTHTETEAMAFREGAVDYIPKPIIAETLLSRVKNHINLSKLMMEFQKQLDEKTRRLRQREEMTFDLLANLTDYRDKTTGGHVMRTVAYVKILVDKLGEISLPGYEIAEADKQVFISSAKLHDIGKIAVKDSLLFKNDKLTPEEYEQMKAHTTLGAEIIEKSFKDIEDVRFLNTAREMALTHQERWDGSGYPKGLSGYDIPVSGRIMAIADVYDALRSKRPYKQRMSHREVFDIIVSESGKAFDPTLVEIFKGCGREFELANAGDT